MAGSARGIRAGKAFVEIGAKDKLSKILDKIGKRLQAFGAGVRAMGVKIAGFGAAALGAFGALTKVFVDFGSALQDMHDRTGLSIEALSELNFIADQTGSSMEDVEAAVRAMQRKIGDLASGSKSAAEAFEALGLTLEDLEDLAPEDQLKLIGRRLAAIPNATLRAAAAMDVLGKSGTKLIPMFKGMDENSRRFKELGLSIPGSAAARADALGDAIGEIAAVAKNAAFWIGDALAPAMANMMSMTTRAMVAVRDWVKANRGVVVLASQVAVGVVSAGAALIGVGLALQVAGLAVSGFAAVLGTAVSALKLMLLTLPALISPTGALVVAIGTLAAAFLSFGVVGGASLDWLGRKFGELVQIGKETIGAITDALAAGDFALAAKVGWAGVKVAFLEAVDELMGVWRSFSAAFEQVFVSLAASIERIWTRLWSKFKSIMEPAIGFATDLILEVQGILDPDFDAEAAKRIRRANDANADPQAELAGRLKEIDSAEADSLAKIMEDFGTRTEAARVALEKARAEFKTLVGKAREERDVAKENGTGVFGLTLPDFSGIGEAIGSKLSSFGTFNASAAFGLGAAGSAMDRTAKATEETAKQAKRIVEAVKTNGPSFA